jgi:hypothetical protein
MEKCGEQIREPCSNSKFRTETEGCLYQLCLGSCKHSFTVLRLVSIVMELHPNFEQPVTYSNDAKFELISYHHFLTLDWTECNNIYIYIYILFKYQLCRSDSGHNKFSKLNITLVLFSQYKCDRFSATIHIGIPLLFYLICQFSKPPVTCC